MNSEPFANQIGQWSNAKLMSFVLNGSAKFQSVDRLTQDLETYYSDFDHIIQATEHSLQEIKGIGPVKARQIMALLALHKAWSLPKTTNNAIRKSGDAFAHFGSLRFLDHEEFHVLYLNRAHLPLSCQSMFIGGLTGTVTDLRLILKRALHLNATSIIVAHNHPSGALQPSENDKRMTKKLHTASETLDIKLLDHLIVARSGYFSFSDQGLL
jgi:DNA repair protein RadC